MKALRKGFTLAELLISLTILALVISGILQLLIVCLLANTTNNNLVIASNDAQYVLETIKGLPYGDVASCSFPSFSFNNLIDENVATACTGENRMTKVTVTVTWKDRNVQKSFALSTRIAE